MADEVKKILKNFFSLSSIEALGRILGFAATIYLARVLGANGFGKLNFAIAVVSYFMLLLNRGFEPFGAREVARNTNETVRYLNNILSMRLIFLIFSYCLLIIFVCSISKPPETKRIILLYGLELFVFAFAFEWVFQAIEKMEIIALGRIVRQVSYVGAIFLLVSGPQNILLVPILRFFAGLLAITLLLGVFIRSFQLPRFRFDFFFGRKSYA